MVDVFVEAAFRTLDKFFRFWLMAELLAEVDGDINCFLFQRLLSGHLHHMSAADQGR